MITYINKTIFQLDSNIFTCVLCPVNKKGALTTELGLFFVKKYDNFRKLFNTASINNEFQNGNVVLVQPSLYEPPIVLFPLKEHWTKEIDLNLIETTLKRFQYQFKELGINELVISKTSLCSKTSNWKDVKLLLTKYLKDLPLNVLVCK